MSQTGTKIKRSVQSIVHSGGYITPFFREPNLVGWFLRITISREAGQLLLPRGGDGEDTGEDVGGGRTPGTGNWPTTGYMGKVTP